MSNRAVFLDRDGTLIEHYDYLTEVGQVELLGKAASALWFLKDRGYKLVLVTNQSAIARGMLTEKKLKEIHNRLESLLAQKKVRLDKIYYCPYHPEAKIDKYRKDSELRKPKGGMLELAAKELEIDLSQSWMVGDERRDIMAGKAAGCRTIMIETQGAPLVGKDGAKADFKAVNMQEAANIIARYGDNTMLDKTKQNEPQEEPVEKEMPTEQSAPDIAEEPTKGAIEKEIMNNKPENQNRTDETEPAEQDNHNTELLREILRELKSSRRERKMGEDFSVSKLVAGLMQMVVVLCLVMAFRAGGGTDPDNYSVMNWLLSAVVFQVMVVAMLVMSKN